MKYIDNFKDTNGLWARQPLINGKQHYTKSGIVWNNIRIRCLAGGAVQIKRPTYIGCVMSENFSDYQYFVEWHQNQIGFGVDGYDIDKDILFSNNKIYSEMACVLVPSGLNSFFCESATWADKYPRGVTFYKSRNKFRARICIDNVSCLLGYFDTIDDASNAYSEAKRNEANRWVLRLESGEFPIDARVIEAIKGRYKL